MRPSESCKTFVCNLLGDAISLRDKMLAERPELVEEEDHPTEHRHIGDAEDRCHRAVGQWHGAEPEKPHRR